VRSGLAPVAAHVSEKYNMETSDVRHHTISVSPRLVAKDRGRTDWGALAAHAIAEADRRQLPAGNCLTRKWALDGEEVVMFINARSRAIYEIGFCFKDQLCKNAHDGQNRIRGKPV